MKHPNLVTLEGLYADLARGNHHAVLAALPEGMTFQVPGKSKLAGKFTKASFAHDFATNIEELSGGTFELEVHDVLASDRHGLVLTTEKLTRAGKLIELRAVHVWRFEGGKPVAWYAYPRDLYQFDAIWS